jgi:hypothetical protein
MGLSSEAPMKNDQERKGGRGQLVPSAPRGAARAELPSGSKKKRGESWGARARSREQLGGRRRWCEF